MSQNARESQTVSARWRVLACAVAMLLAVGFSASATVRAQDATPASTGECVAPDLPPGAPTDPGAATAESMDMEEAEATPSAEEVAAEEDPGTPAEGETADAIIAAATNIANCVNSGDLEGGVALLTEDMLESEFGTTNPYDVLEMLTDFSFGEISFENPRTYADGSVSVDATFWQSDYQLFGETWYMIQDGDYWKVDGTGNFTPDYEGDSAVVGVTLGEATDDAGAVTYSITPNRPSNTQTEVLLFHVINAGTIPHELVVVKIPDGADPMGLLDGTIAETDMTFVGQISLDAGEEADMVLVGLEPGVYTLVCFFPDDMGMPHVANGMVAQFEVLAAS